MSRSSSLGIKIALIFATVWLIVYGLVIMAQQNALGEFKENLAYYEESLRGIHKIKAKFYDAKEMARWLSDHDSGEDRAKAVQSIEDCVKEIGPLEKWKQNDPKIRQGMGEIKRSINSYLTSFNHYAEAVRVRGRLKEEIIRRMERLDHEVKNLVFENWKQRLEAARQNILVAFLNYETGKSEWPVFQDKFVQAEKEFDAWMTFAGKSALKKEALSILSHVKEIRGAILQSPDASFDHKKYQTEMETHSKNISAIFTDMADMNHPLKKILDSSNLLFFKYMAIFFLMGLMFSIVAIRKWFLEPMTRLKKSARELAAGNLNASIDTRRRDELGSVAKSFDIMRIKIREYIQKIESKNEALQQLTENIYASRLKAMEDLGAGIAHEINQPLAIIKLKTERLLNDFSPEGLADPADVETWRKILENNLFQIKRTDDILNKLHMFVKDDSKPYASSNLKYPVDWVLSLFKAQLRKNKILLTTDLPENLPQVNVRPRSFRFLALNLLTNARFAVNERQRRPMIPTTKNRYRRDSHTPLRPTSWFLRWKTTASAWIP